MVPNIIKTSESLKVSNFFFFNLLSSVEAYHYSQINVQTTN